MRFVAEKVLTFGEARAVVEKQATDITAVRVENLTVSDAIGRVAAKDLRADRDYPPFPRATRDGYAVRAADVQQVPARLRVIGQIKAGDSFSRGMNAEECVEIMTGAAVPSGA